MPMLIEHIDAIARKKGRNVLFLRFPQEQDEDDVWSGFVEWECQLLIPAIMIRFPADC